MSGEVVSQSAHSGVYWKYTLSSKVVALNKILYQRCQIDPKFKSYNLQLLNFYSCIDNN